MGVGNIGQYGRGEEAVGCEEGKRRRQEQNGPGSRHDG